MGISAILARTQYARKRLSALPGVKLTDTALHLREFVVDFSGTSIASHAVVERLRAQGIEPGVVVGEYELLVCVTEMTTQVIPGGGPAQWPKATVSMKRYVRESRFVNLCSLRWTSPITGTSAELNFTTFGTSLRGARQQRKSQPITAGTAAGWAKWYGPTSVNAATVFSSGEANDKTLDGDL